MHDEALDRYTKREPADRYCADFDRPARDALDSLDGQPATQRIAPAAAEKSDDSQDAQHREDPRCVDHPSPDDVTAPGAHGDSCSGIFSTMMRERLSESQR